MLIATKDSSEIDRLKVMLNFKFEMKDLGATKNILRMEISRDRPSGKLFLSQQQYIKKVSEHFAMHDLKPVGTPITTHFKLSVSSSPQTKRGRKVHV